MNPVRANIVNKPEEYRNSSYRSFINRKKEDIVFRELIGGISYAAISKAYHRFDIKLKGDKSLVKVIKKLEDRMSHV